jgi:hypothetical protein
MLKLHGLVWPDTLEHLRTCGSRRVECVVLWTGPIDEPGVVDRAVHPAHVSTRVHYRIDPTWMHGFHVSLLRERRAMRAQTHTHAGRAFHSPTDDAWPAVNTPGFCSLVVPRFANEPVRVEEMWLAVLGPDGEWSGFDPRRSIQGLP